MISKPINMYYVLGVMDMIHIEFGNFVCWINSGSKKHHTYRYLKNLPVIFVNDYKDIDLKFLLSEEKNLIT